MIIKERLKAFRKKIIEGVCKICFCHVPKCAGTSVGFAIPKQSFKLHERILIPNFGISVVASGRASKITSSSIIDLREEILAYVLSLPEYKFVSGHVVCRPKLVEEFYRTWNFITILRNPVDRWISEYIYNTYDQQYWPKNTLPIEEYVESEIGGITGMMYIRYFSNISNECVDSIKIQSYINEAIDNLKRFSIVGIIEDMNDFVKQYETVFGKRLKLPRKNISLKIKVKQQIKEDMVLMARIEKLCEPDRHVYQSIVEQAKERNSVIY